MVPFMGSPQTLTQRLVPAFAVALVSTLVLGAVVVTADVATDDSPLLPQTLTIATPHQGDAWRYNVTLRGAWTFGLDDTVRVNTSIPFGIFQWGAPAKIRGGDGALHDANAFLADHLVYEPLWIDEYMDENQTFPLPTGVFYGSHLGPSQEPYWNEVNSTQWVRSGGHEVLSRGSRTAHNESDTQYGQGMGPVSVGGQWYEAYWEDGLIEYPRDEAPCLAINPLQGGNVSLAQPIVLFDGCSLGGDFLTIPEDLAFHATGIDTVSGVEAVRFDARHNGTYSVWFAPAVPYPVRLDAQLPSERGEALEYMDRDAPGARSLSLEMVGFLNGTTDLVATDEPTDPAPSFALAPPAVFTSEYGTLRVGPDESDLDHDFPLSEAITQALDPNAGFADLKTYLGNKPDAYVASASYIEGTGMYTTTFPPTSEISNQYDRVWIIGMSDGKDSILFTAIKSDYSTVAPQPLREPFAQAMAQRPVYQFQRGGYDPYYYSTAPYMDSENTPAPYPSHLPAEMPSAISLMARWAAFDGSGTPANAYGFNIGCVAGTGGDNGPCDMVMSYFAGVSRQETSPFEGPALPGDPYGASRFVIIQRNVAFEPDGTATAMFVHDERRYQSSSGPTGESWGEAVPDGNVGQDPGYDVQSVAVSGIPSPVTQWVPEGKEAASIGFFGILIGALYWIWPKLGMVGLFSRLHRGELLDHPARAKLVQIVESQPGIHFHDLALKAELANGTAVHHLRKLSDSGHLSVRRSGRYTCYFPGGRVDPHAAAAAPLLKSDGAKQILEAVRNKPGMSNLELAQATGLQPSTVNYHVQRLSQAGLVAALRDGRNVRLHPGIRAGGADPTPAAAA